MARFMLAWELGSGLGHLTKLAPVARALVAAGHEVHLVLRDLSQAAAALGPAARSPQVRLWQAPVWADALQGVPAPATYAELLFHAGYLRPDRLLALAQAWRSLLELTGPQLLLADHAPTALLAARGLPLRTALMGHGFFEPPRLQPLPVFRDWDPIPAARVAEGEGLALANCNQVLAALGGPALAALCDLTAADAQFLITWPELDPYAPPGQPRAPAGRDAAQFLGPLPAPDEGPPAEWPPGDGPALFVYLRTVYPGIDAVLQALAASPWRVLVHAAGLDAARRQKHAGPRLRFSPGPVSMASALRQAQAVVCHAGAGVVAESLQAGLPLLLLPMQAEQTLNARRVMAAGCGVALMPAQLATGLAPALQRLGRDGELARRARELRDRHADPSAPPVVDHVTASCIALAGAAP